MFFYYVIPLPTKALIALNLMLSTFLEGRARILSFQNIFFICTFCCKYTTPIHLKNDGMANKWTPIAGNNGGGPHVDPTVATG